MKLTVSLLFLALPCWAAAQVIAYFDEFMREVLAGNDYHYFAEIEPLPGGGFYVMRYRADSVLVSEGAYSTFSWENYFFAAIEPLPGGGFYIMRYRTDNTLVPEGTYSVFNQKKRIPQGIHQNYRPTGELWYTQEYMQGKQSGELRSYYPSGALKRIEQFANDRSIGGQCFAEDGSSIPFTPFETASSYPGGPEALSLLTKKIRYPVIALENGVEGVVQVAFIVGKDGVARDFIPVRDIGAGCGEEAVRVLRLMGPWSPGIRDDETIPMRFVLPVVYKR